MELLGADLVNCSQLDGMVCNGAVTLKEACIRAAQVRPDLTLPVCNKISKIESDDIAVGTCRPPDFS